MRTAARRTTCASDRACAAPRASSLDFGRLPAHGFPAYVPPSTNVYDRLTDIDAAAARGYAGRRHFAQSRTGSSARDTLTSITAWRYWDWDVANDRDYTGVPIQLVQRIPSRQDQYSQELRLASNGDGPLNYVGGLYFFRQSINGRPTSVYGPAAAYWLISTTNFTRADRPDNLLDGYGQYGDSHFTMKSYAAFGELNYRILPRLTGTLGLRYTYEDKHGDYSTQVVRRRALLHAAGSGDLHDARRCGAQRPRQRQALDLPSAVLFRR